MFAVDTSTISAYLKSGKGPDVDAFESALISKNIFLPPIVLTELLSAPAITVELAKYFSQFPLLQIDSRYWVRVAETRRKLLAKKLKSNLGDACIAQSCIDHNVKLIARDEDFRHFHKHCGLMLVTL